MSFLLRKSTGNFNLNNSITIEEFENFSNETIHEMIIPVDKALSDLKKIDVSGEIELQMSNGIKINQIRFSKEPFDSSDLKDKEFLLTYCEGMFYGISIYKKATDEIVMDKLFNTGD
jgi:tRNA pseudouridine55 synthase